MPDRCGSQLTTREHAAALEKAASEEACLAEELAFLASFLENHMAARAWRPPSGIPHGIGACKA
jgi:hypothetical protein